MHHPVNDEAWVARYERSHLHPVNRVCHLVGIPLIVIALPVAVLGFFHAPLWWLALALFIAGWLLQFVGHAVEGKPPEFFSDWRFLLVGLKWWVVKLRRPRG